MRKAAYSPVPPSYTMAARDDSFYEAKARVIEALANPKRLAILDLLGDAERPVSELSSSLGLPQATTSQHLSVLRRAGVVATRREGNFVYYRIADPRITAACRAMSDAVVQLLRIEQERLGPALALSARMSAAEGGT